MRKQKHLLIMMAMVVTFPSLLTAGEEEDPDPPQKLFAPSSAPTSPAEMSTNPTFTIFTSPRSGDFMIPRRIPKIPRFNFPKLPRPNIHFPKVPAPVRRAACPVMCSTMCIGSGGYGWFALCTSPCLLTCFGNNGSGGGGGGGGGGETSSISSTSTSSTDVIHDCTLACTKGLTTHFGLDANGDYVEICYKSCNRY